MKWENVAIARGKDDLADQRESSNDFDGFTSPRIFMIEKKSRFRETMKRYLLFCRLGFKVKIISTKSWFFTSAGF